MSKILYTMIILCEIEFFIINYIHMFIFLVNTLK
nr:MAG TPA: hypothetical protein [Caudoviricetes sp.]